MGRSLLFRHLRRTLQVAQWCNRLQLPTREGLEIAAQAHGLDAMARRDFLRSMGSTLALGTLGMLKITQASDDTNTTQERLGTRSSGRQLEASIGIVGAGLAGLTCARELQRWGLKPVVYEASDHVGGRCYSLNDVFPNQVVERGGELIDTTHTTMRSLAQEFGLSVENLERVPGETFYHFIGQRHSEVDVVDEYRALVPALHTDLRHLGSPTADDFSPYDQELDFTDLATYLDTRGASDLINAVLDVTYTIEYGLGIDRQSCLNLLFFIHADRRSKWTPFGVFSDERYHVVEGNQRIPESLALTLQKPVTFARTLVRVARTAAGRIELTFVVRGRGSTQTVVHDAVVLTVPFSVLRHIELDASLALPDWKRYAIDHLGYGTNAKLMLGFHGPFWRAQGSNGDSYSDLTYHQNTWETNPSRATRTSAVLTDYTGGDLGASLNPKNPQRDADRFLTDLEELYPGAGNAAIRDAHGGLLLHLEHWPSNPLSMGSYTCSQPGYFTTIAGNEGKPVGNLFFAGEHTNSFYEYQGFMEGACLSGLQAAADLLDLLR